MAPKAPASAPSPATPAAEVIEVQSHRLACDGVGGALGHPRVYLEMGQSGSVECPYCDRRFVLKAGAHEGAPGVYAETGGH